MEIENKVNSKPKLGTILENEKGKDVFIYTENFSFKNDTSRLVDAVEKLLPYSSKSSPKKPKKPQKPKEPLTNGS